MIPTAATLTAFLLGLCEPMSVAGALILWFAVSELRAWGRVRREAR